MPKSSAFCMHCMRGLDEKDYQFKPPEKGNKKALILCACALAVAIIGTALFLTVGHKKIEAEGTSAPAPSSTTAAPTTAAATEKPTKTTTKKPKTTKKQTTKKEAATQAPAAQEEAQQYEPAQPATKAPETTAPSTQVVFDGSVLTDYPNARTDSSYTIPYSVTSIASGAFHGNSYLRTLKFSKRTNLSCNWSNLFANLPNLETIYIYTGTSADTQGMQYFDGEIIYYYD